MIVYLLERNLFKPEGKISAKSFGLHLLTKEHIGEQSSGLRNGDVEYGGGESLYVIKPESGTASHCWQGFITKLRWDHLVPKNPKRAAAAKVHDRKLRMYKKYCPVAARILSEK